MKKVSFLAICAGLCATIFFAGSFANGGDSTSYNPTSITVKANNTGTPVGTIIAWPSATSPGDIDKWLECNGASFDQSKYAKLFALLGTNRVPNLNGEFLRGTTVASAVLTQKEDSIKSHEITVAPHTHEFEGKETSGSISGVAAGQNLEGGIAEGQEYVGVESGGAGGEILFRYSNHPEIQISSGNFSYNYHNWYDPRVGGVITVDDRFSNSHTSLFDKYKSYFTIGKKLVEKANLNNVTSYIDNETDFAVIQDKGYNYIWDLYSTKINSNGEKVASSKLGTLNLNGNTFSIGSSSYRYYTESFDSFSGYYRLLTGSGIPTNLTLSDAQLSGYAQASAVTGSLNTQSSGSVVTTDELKGSYSGAAETAPRHTLVRYFIKALP